MTAPTPADIDAIRERHEKHRNEIWFTPETVDTLLAAIRERDATIERLTKEAAIWDAQAGARHADVAVLEAEVARLTAERDEAAAKERERCVAALRGLADNLTNHARNLANDDEQNECYVSLSCADSLRYAADAIARGEPQGENNGTH